jgi:hypothetical protein
LIDPKQPAKNWAKILLDAGALFGIASFVFGLYLIWYPLAPLVGGLMLAGGCAFAGYDRFRRERSN